MSVTRLPNGRNYCEPEKSRIAGGKFVESTVNAMYNYSVITALLQQGLFFLTVTLEILQKTQLNVCVYRKVKVFSCLNLERNPSYYSVITV